MKKLNKQVLVFTAIGIILGFLLATLISPSDDQTINTSSHQHINTSDDQSIESSEIWTCSMHPQVRQPEPGQCPICGMDLIPASTTGGSGSSSPAVLEMSEAAVALAEVQTFTVRANESGNEIYTTGKVQANERSRSTLAANFPGRIEQLFINFTGQAVRKGEKLAEVYSPELVNAQKELLEATKTKSDFPDLYAAAKQKLRSWKITPEQIESIESGGELIERFAVLADRSGIVIQRNVAEGNYVTTGEPLFEIVNLSAVWVMLDIYEQQLPFVRNGDKVSLTVEGIPGETFESTVSYLDPFIDPDTRTAQARVVLNNPGDRLMPEMFVNANIQSSGNLGEGTLSIPRTALLWSGNRSVVYVRVPDATYPTYEMREVNIGPRNGEIYPVLDGLQVGEEVVSNGVFSIDAAAQLAGNYSLLNRPESKTIEVSSAFRQQLTVLAEAYFELKNALVADDTEEARKASQQVGVALSKVEMHLVEGDAHAHWMELKAEAENALQGIREASGIQAVHKQFMVLSESMLEITESFGLEKDKVYRQYCPMAFGDQGAFWLSETEEIRNPYFGEDMLRCGEVRATYEKGKPVMQKNSNAGTPAGGGHNH
ncbi:efflux RND transporter periplasmic adaptor subunit [Cyclobacterium jeungdonense]|uniref:Efflux RND transporter periplasmic adaptor subunit n=1 Tax=Cyclobacterium jeungdonense TaxID=708087 RepID=A0ABT8C4I0_9BACT|nr:efflux RND transporter periplasmic adaptor subunit [Cyclobacterium jeungdonense]MDN3687287.1 efflux RND transporter periplasmic adaptor subunit [Cyclobacterium jeungdonense]